MDEPSEVHETYDVYLADMAKRDVDSRLATAVSVINPGQRDLRHQAEVFANLYATTLGVNADDYIAKMPSQSAPIPQSKWAEDMPVFPVIVQPPTDSLALSDICDLSGINYSTSGGRGRTDLTKVVTLGDRPNLPYSVNLYLAEGGIDRLSQLRELASPSLSGDVRVATLPEVIALRVAYPSLLEAINLDILGSRFGDSHQNSGVASNDADIECLFMRLLNGQTHLDRDRIALPHTYSHRIVIAGTEVVTAKPKS